jgi:hypothetical protein
MITASHLFVEKKSEDESENIYIPVFRSSKKSIESLEHKYYVFSYSLNRMQQIS